MSEIEVNGWRWMEMDKDGWVEMDAWRCMDGVAEYDDMRHIFKKRRAMTAMHCGHKHLKPRAEGDRCATMMRSQQTLKHHC